MTVNRDNGAGSFILLDGARVVNDRLLGITRRVAGRADRRRRVSFAAVAIINLASFLCDWHGHRLNKWVSESRENGTALAGRLGMIRRAASGAHSRIASASRRPTAFYDGRCECREYAYHWDLRRPMQIIHKCVWRWERSLRWPS